MKQMMNLAIPLVLCTTLFASASHGEDRSGPGYEVFNQTRIDYDDGQGVKLRKHETTNLTYLDLSSCEVKRDSFSREETGVPIVVEVPMRSNTYGISNPNGAWVKVPKIVGYTPGVRQSVSYEFTATECYSGKSWVETEKKNLQAKINNFFGAMPPVEYNASYGIATEHRITPRSFIFERKQTYALQEAAELNPQIEKQSRSNVMGEAKKACEVARMKFIAANSNRFTDKANSECRNIQGTLPVQTRSEREFLQTIRTSDEATRTDLIKR